MEPMRGIMKYYKIWLPVLSVLIFFGVAEMICRGFSLTEKYDADFKFYIHNVSIDTEQDFNVEDPSLMWSPRPHYADGLFNINSTGLRDKERKIKKDRNVFRILCLGDSSTFGLYLPLKNIYHSLLEERLNREYASSQIRFEVINAGVTGYTSYQGLCFYKQKGFLYEPDVVTFYFGANDCLKDFYLSDKQIIPDDIPSAFKAAVEKNLLLKLDSYRLLRKFIAGVYFRHRSNAGETVLRVSPEDYEKNILELNRLCIKNGSRLLLIPPFYNKRDAGKLRHERKAGMFKQLVNISKKYSIPMIMVPEMTEGAPVDITRYFMDSVHPNETGHRMIMGKIYDYLENNKLLPEKHIDFKH